MMEAGKATFKTEGKWNDWHWQWRKRIKTPAELIRVTHAPATEAASWVKVASQYPISVTPYFLSLASLDNLHDPILRQFTPDIKELDPTSGPPDPLLEENHMPVPGLIRRYRDRCLILTTSLCAVYCRHCNRKRRWQQRNHLETKEYFSTILGYIARDSSLREVILSGGDPLTLPDGAIEFLLKNLRAISHVEVIRIGTRVPVVMPMRITSNLCNLLKKYRPLWLNTQFNHPREITHLSAEACDRLVSSGIPVSNQSVLLKGINDDFPTLQSLFTGLERISVRPYYLFQCDPVRGTTHFRVAVERGRELMKQLWASTSGLCLPRYVADLPETPGKVSLEGEGFDKEEKNG